MNMDLMILKNKCDIYNHNKLGDCMNDLDLKELYWLLFKNTGKIEYYLKYKSKEDEDGSNSGEGL